MTARVDQLESVDSTEFIASSYSLSATREAAHGIGELRYDRKGLHSAKTEKAGVESVHRKERRKWCSRQ